MLDKPLAAIGKWADASTSLRLACPDIAARLRTAAQAAVPEIMGSY